MYPMYLSKFVLILNHPFFLESILNSSPYKIWDVINDLDDGFEFIFPKDDLKKLLFT